MDNDLILTQAVTNAHAAGALSDEQRAKVAEFLGTLEPAQRREILKAVAIDWGSLLTILPKLLPMLLALIPGIGPFAGIITTLLPFIMALINQTPLPTPSPVPPVVVPDGGGDVPTPH